MEYDIFMLFKKKYILYLIQDKRKCYKKSNFLHIIIMKFIHVYKKKLTIN